MIQEPVTRAVNTTSLKKGKNAFFFEDNIRVRESLGVNSGVVALEYSLQRKTRVLSFLYQTRSFLNNVSPKDGSPVAPPTLFEQARVHCDHPLA